MSYEVLILVFLLLAFCTFFMLLTVNIMLAVARAFEKGEIESIKMSDILPKRKSKPKEKISKQQKADKERFDAIMHNIEVYDGSGRGQIEVE